jgi:hypothetical protein
LDDLIFYIHIQGVQHYNISRRQRQPAEWSQVPYGESKISTAVLYDRFMQFEFNHKPAKIEKDLRVIIEKIEKMKSVASISFSDGDWILPNDRSFSLEVISALSASPTCHNNETKKLRQESQQDSAFDSYPQRSSSIEHTNHIETNLQTLPTTTSALQLPIWCSPQRYYLLSTPVLPVRQVIRHFGGDLYGSLSNIVSLRNAMLNINNVAEPAQFHYDDYTENFQSSVSSYSSLPQINTNAEGFNIGQGILHRTHPQQYIGLAPKTSIHVFQNHLSQTKPSDDDIRSTDDRKSKRKRGD